jgi:hypothetical protein
MSTARAPGASSASLRNSLLSALSFSCPSILASCPYLSGGSSSLSEVEELTSSGAARGWAPLLLRLRELLENDDEEEYLRGGAAGTATPSSWSGV